MTKIPPMMAGFIFPNLFIINELIVANIKKVIINGNCTFPASIASPPNPRGIGVLTNCTIVGYIKNIVIPVSVNKIYEGRIILCLIIAKSINGKLLLFSIAINNPNDKADRPKDNRTNAEFELFPVSNKVNPIKNVVIVTERNMPPLMSILLFFFFLLKVSIFSDKCCSRFFEGTNIDIIIVTVAATGDIKKKVECQPKV